MKRRIAIIALCVTAPALIAGCSGTATDTAATPTASSSPSGQVSKPGATPAAGETARSSQALSAAGAAVLTKLKTKDYPGLAALVDPQAGLRFTTHGFVDVEHDKVFLPTAVAELGKDPTNYDWGSDPGSGEPITMKFHAYNKRFVYTADFLNADQVAQNERISQGSSLNNIPEAFPGSQFIEYHFAGSDDQYGGLDWQSLRLVFTGPDNNLRLVGIVHDSWTP